LCCSHYFYNSGHHAPAQKHEDKQETEEVIVDGFVRLQRSKMDDLEVNMQ
jgi:hypothetical protein